MGWPKGWTPIGRTETLYGVVQRNDDGVVFFLSDILLLLFDD
jgi:hypothetical protein